MASNIPLTAFLAPMYQPRVMHLTVQRIYPTVLMKRSLKWRLYFRSEGYSVPARFAISGQCAPSFPTRKAALEWCAEHGMKAAYQYAHKSWIHPIGGASETWAEPRASEMCATEGCGRAASPNGYCQTCIRMAANQCDRGCL